MDFPPQAAGHRCTFGRHMHVRHRIRDGSCIPRRQAPNPRRFGARRSLDTRDASPRTSLAGCARRAYRPRPHRAGRDLPEGDTHPDRSDRPPGSAGRPGIRATSGKVFPAAMCHESIHHIPAESTAAPVLPSRIPRGHAPSPRCSDRRRPDRGTPLSREAQNSACGCIRWRSWCLAAGCSIRTCARPGAREWPRRTSAQRDREAHS
jgi:hypothetical protein